MICQTKDSKFYEWCKMKKVFSYVDVDNYKHENKNFLSADRRVREYVENKKLRRIPDAEAVLRGLRKEGRAALAWFEIV